MRLHEIEIYDVGVRHRSEQKRGFVNYQLEILDHQPIHDCIIPKLKLSTVSQPF